jgi:DNA invertase Pin-like site-specific DNA recombinase
MTATSSRTRFIPIDDRDQPSVRALIFARTSNAGGGVDDVESQIDQCLTFIRAMGWTLVRPTDPKQPNAVAFVETKSGVRRVKRPMLERATTLAMAGEVDVIVCLTPARIARRKGLRYAAIETCNQVGVEFRFVEYAANGAASRPATRGYWPN